MANEISIGVNANLANGDLRDQFNYTSQIDQTNQRGNKITMTATLAGATVDFGEIVLPARIMMVNLDPINFVTFGPDSGGLVPLGVIRPGGEPVGPIYLPAGVTLIVQADTADSDIVITAWQD